MKLKNPNKLIHENSPYLLQHAYNPVKWHAWDPSILKLAKKEHKPLLISIGYAACHWCHVMEEECFEDSEVAKVMNSKFINIKIDREEHPDIDHLYMNALQLMQNTGGWPLNIIALPDGRPFWGATYVRKNEWIQTLHQLSEIYVTQPQKVIEYADKLEKGLALFNLTETSTKSHLSIDAIKNAVYKWKQSWDTTYGGNNGAPKFIMPVHYTFLLSYAYHTNDTFVKTFIENTLTHISNGGIYDCLGGGFSRYSVDEQWHVPHFEKMLYDNAQLISLYAQAYNYFKNPDFIATCIETIEFTFTELNYNNTAFYASLDADSLNTENIKEEGAYYVWTKPELKQLLKEHYAVFKKAYNINKTGYWENNNYVLYKTESIKSVAQAFKLSAAETTTILKKCRTILYKERLKRNAPAIDTKILTGWNALMITALVEAYYGTENLQYLEKAKTVATFIITNLTNEKEQLIRSLKETKPILGYLEDYSLTIQGLLQLFEATGELSCLEQSEKYTNICMDEYYDTASGLFFFSSNEIPVVVQRTIEKSDNVIPASTSVMADNLEKLYVYTSKEHYRTIAIKMRAAMSSDAVSYPRSYANWMKVLLKQCCPAHEIVIIGKEAQETLMELKKIYLPNVIFAISKTNSTLPIFKNRYKEGKTLIYVCTNNSCNLPVESIEEALEKISK
ncbi:thioredoxin [Neptunitalea chrysea]|uniref:Thioredoxin n=1 Tax=Neptunitalea chrysea TaxID=1647581 RepID=A0A9W6B2I4_9FLAO|nr:thioredoxin domain-containing protein [Neptunitalea chrysea]GLB51026.1 thioredoxin [Neptunitalea chrysea]